MNQSINMDSFDSNSNYNSFNDLNINKNSKNRKKFGNPKFKYDNTRRFSANTFTKPKKNLFNISLNKRRRISRQFKGPIRFSIKNNTNEIFRINYDDSEIDENKMIDDNNKKSKFFKNKIILR